MSSEIYPHEIEDGSHFGMNSLQLSNISSFEGNFYTNELLAFCWEPLQWCSWESRCAHKGLKTAQYPKDHYNMDSLHHTRVNEIRYIIDNCLPFLFIAVIHSTLANKTNKRTMLAITVVAIMCQQYAQQDTDTMTCFVTYKHCCSHTQQCS